MCKFVLCVHARFQIIVNKIQKIENYDTINTGSALLGETISYIRGSGWDAADYKADI